MMAKLRVTKMKVPERIAGFKVPKQIRKSELLRGLLASKAGREIPGRALVAGASAAAAVLVVEHNEVADVIKKASRKGARKLGLLSAAAQNAADAAVDVVTDAARAMLSEMRDRKTRKARASTEAGPRH